MLIRKIDPYTKCPLNKDGNGNLYSQQGNQRSVYMNYNGSYDFTASKVSITNERKYYDRHYKDLTFKKLTLKEIQSPWYDETMPEHLVLLNSLGDLSGKTVLLLGNGTSFKEFYFLDLGARVVYSDISIEAVNYAKELFFHSELQEIRHENIEFHAIDALHLPFPDDSFDVIYGYAFVHHIEELEQFFSEVNRCLKKDGICRFLDDAYSPIWQFIKNLLLKPLQQYIHKKMEYLRKTKEPQKEAAIKKRRLFNICIHLPLESSYLYVFHFFCAYSEGDSVKFLDGTQR